MEHEIRRRELFKILGAGSAAAALVGCQAEAPEILTPYVVPPANLVPGIATWYATVCRECPAGCGMVVRTREGRAVKCEGNPAHPVNQGRLCARGQAALQGLYNPDRIQQPLRRAQDGTFHPLSWNDAEAQVAARLTELRQSGNVTGIAFLTSQLSGTLDDLIDAWLSALGSKLRYTFEPFAYESLRTSYQITFGRDVIPSYDLGASKYLISFGADFLESWISPVAFARDFSKMRAFRDGGFGSFTYVGPRLSMTAANADAWIQIKPGTEMILALGMMQIILAENLSAPLTQTERNGFVRLVTPYTLTRVAQLTEVSEEKIVQLARAFAQTRPSLALSGGVGVTGSNATATCVAINLLNYVVGNIGLTIRFGPNVDLRSRGTYRDLLDFVEDMQQDNISLLFLYGANPVFNIPDATAFRSALEHVPLVVSLSSCLDETTAHAHLVLPDHTPPESWGDDVPRTGVHGLMQPVMQPLFQTKAVGDTLLSLAKKIDTDMAEQFPSPSFYTYLRDRWRTLHQHHAPDIPYETFWRQALGQGGVWEEPKTDTVRLSQDVFEADFTPATFKGKGNTSLYLHLYPSVMHFDGRSANRPWLQELPDPMTKIAWDNWLEIHPDTARRLGITEGEVVELVSPHGALEMAVHVYAWIRPDVVAIPLGQGHSGYGRYADNRGGNPMMLLPPQAEPVSGSLMFLATKVNIRRTGKHHVLVSTVGSDRQEGRGIAQAVPLSDLMQDPQPEHTTDPHRIQMYPPHAHPGHRWGMVIDLQACIGCSACEAACYAENNLPIVGKEQMARGREMSWLRIERYVDVVREKPDIRFIPMLCQHCDQAPCEPVCPVYATYHNPEGLNVQVYNRCVGTRYCSNNCPYKVRRFNWFEYTWPEPLGLQLNPDVSVRSRGVMEKCTFCVQRIREAKERAKNHDTLVRDGDIVPACAQTCPTQALVFGDLNDPESLVSKRSRDARRYHVLDNLNTKPAITYLKKIHHDLEGV
jgi:molybdopterin-containing oxidoreductase family iron-sulfur binding subunit